MKMTCMFTVSTLLFLVAATASNLRLGSQEGPDVSAEVRKDALQNIDIHSGFAAQAASDAEVQKQVEANHELRALVQVGSKEPAFLQVASRRAPEDDLAA